MRQLAEAAFCDWLQKGLFHPLVPPDQNRAYGLLPVTPSLAVREKDDPEQFVPVEKVPERTIQGTLHK